MNRAPSRVMNAMKTIGNRADVQTSRTVRLISRLRGATVPGVDADRPYRDIGGPAPPGAELDNHRPVVAVLFGNNADFPEYASSVERSSRVRLEGVRFLAAWSSAGCARVSFRCGIERALRRATAARARARSYTCRSRAWRIGAACRCAAVSRSARWRPRGAGCRAPSRAWSLTRARRPPQVETLTARGCSRNGRIAQASWRFQRPSFELWRPMVRLRAARERRFRATASRARPPCAAWVATSSSLSLRPLMRGPRAAASTPRA